MDIEGAEYGALQGAAGLIRANSPILAICLYHDPQDFWRIPLLMSELAPEAQLFLRPYAADGFELVCYAVPPARLLDTSCRKRQDAGVEPPGTQPVGVGR
jgi:hypothetical protein